MNIHFAYFLPGWINTISAATDTLLAVLMAAAGAGVWWSCRRRFRLRKAAEMQPSAVQPKSSGNPNIADLLNSIHSISGSRPNILLAADHHRDLPVTIPVRLAIQLAQKGPCLLIDLDTQRNAVALAFDIRSSEFTPHLKLSPIQTDIDNLWIWPARYFDLLRQMNLRSLLESAANKFQTILLYAPTLSTLPDRRQIAACSQYAIVFKGGQSNHSMLNALLQTGRCRILHEV